MGTLVSYRILTLLLPIYIDGKTLPKPLLNSADPAYDLPRHESLTRTISPVTPISSQHKWDQHFRLFHIRHILLPELRNKSFLLDIDPVTVYNTGRQQQDE